MATNTNRFGPGTLYAAPYGTAVPTSVSSALDPAFVAMGNTFDGNTFTYQIQTADLMIEESYFATETAPTGVQETLTFNLSDYTANHLSMAYNQGFTASPVGPATIVSPTLQSETRLTIVWQSNDANERWYYRKCHNTGAVTVQRRKAPNQTVIAFSMRIEDPLGGLSRWGAFFSTALNI